MNKPPVILIADDEGAQRQLVSDALIHAGMSTLSCENGHKALDNIGNCDLLLLDVKMPDMSGLEVLKKACALRPELPIILLTAYIDLRDAVEAIKLGARDYLEKPVDIDELITVIEETLGIHADVSERMALPKEIIAESTSMYAVFQQAHKVAQTDTTVLILGESGVGKEIVAGFIHNTSKRAGRPWTVVDCSALPEKLVESVLFGHEKGAFTGADSAHKGHFVQADGGTLFLDEIGELPLQLQPKLLRVLETGAFQPVGGNKEQRVDVRLIAATNRNLQKEVERGAFREDLYYRLNVFPIEIPPLRERREDIPELAAVMLKQYRKMLTPAAERLLMAYDWPGNVRELKNTLERASILSEGMRILPDALPETVRKSTGRMENEGVVLVGNMAEIERRAIMEALEKTGGNKTQAAQVLGISRRSLIYKLRVYEKEPGYGDQT